MKAVRFGLAQIIVLCFLMGLSDTASARTSVYVRFGGGHPRFNRGHRSGYRRGTHKFPRHNRYFKPVGRSGRWRHYRPRVKTVIVGSGYWYYGKPDYYVVTPPPRVIEKQVVVDSTSSPQIVQPQGYDENTQQLFKELRYRKSKLLEKLQTPDKRQRMEAIDELAGFSFDDKVRYALENVLLSDPDAELRKEVAQAFGKVNNTKALAALEKARVEDSNEDVRKEADNAIRKIEGN